MNVEIKSVRPTRIDNVFVLRDRDRKSGWRRCPHPTDDALEYDGRFYRPWSPATSKLSSMILKGMQVPLNAKSRVLYLGAASGTTVTHVSDIAPTALSLPSSSPHGRQETCSVPLLTGKISSR